MQGSNCFIRFHSLLGAVNRQDDGQGSLVRLPFQVPFVIQNIALRLWVLSLKCHMEKADRGNARFSPAESNDFSSAQSERLSEHHMGFFVVLQC